MITFEQEKISSIYITNLNQLLNFLSRKIDLSIRVERNDINKRTEAPNNGILVKR